MTTGTTTTTGAYTTLHALAEECEAHASAWDQRHDPDGHAAAWDALHALLLAAGAWVEHFAKVRPDLTPTAVDDIATSVRRLAAHLTVAEGDARRPTTPNPTPAEIEAAAAPCSPTASGGPMAADPYSTTHGGTQATQDALSPAYLDRLTLAAIERRAAAADGPWTLHGPDPEAQWWTIRDATGRLVATAATAEEAMLIADAPVDISRLLAEVRRLRADLEHARAVVAETTDA